MVVPFVGAEIGIEAVGDGVKATEIAKAALFLASDESAYMTESERPSVAEPVYVYPQPYYWGPRYYYSYGW